MFNVQNKCIRSGNNSRLKLGEKRAFMYIRNLQRKKYLQLKIDGCEKISGYKCDFGVYLCDSDERLLIELKGSDIKHAITQLEATLHHYKLSPNGVKCIIITSNNPLSATSMQIQKKIFLTNNCIQLFIEKASFEYNYS